MRDSTRNISSDTSIPAERRQEHDALDLHLHLFVVLAVGERGDPRPHAGLGAAHDLVRVRAERIEAELRREPHELAAAGPARRHLGAEIPDHLLCESHVAPQNREELLVRRAVVVELERRDDEPLFVDLLAEPRALAPADVDVVHAVDGETDEALAAERGRGNEHVGGLAIADPGVVADVHVARADRLGREVLKKIPPVHRHHPGMPRRPEPGLPDETAPVVVESGGHVVHFDHVVGERGAKHRRRHLVGDRDQPRPDDVQGFGRLVGTHGASSRSTAMTSDP